MQSLQLFYFVILLYIFNAMWPDWQKQKIWKIWLFFTVYLNVWTHSKHVKQTLKPSLANVSTTFLPFLIWLGCRPKDTFWVLRLAALLARQL